MATKKTKETPTIADALQMQGDPEMKLVEQSSDLIAVFAAARQAFWKKANQMDAAAKLTFAYIRQLPIPTTAEQDATVQQLAKKTAQAKEEVEAHFEIAQVVHRLHRALTSRRKATTDVLDQARATAERLHNTYADAERRRAAEEQDRQIINEQAAALKAEPITVEVPDVPANIITPAGVSGDRTTWSAELLSERELVAWIVKGLQKGDDVPGDLLCIDSVKLNQYARQMHEAINRWPGVRAKKTTRVV